MRNLRIACLAASLILPACSQDSTVAPGPPPPAPPVLIVRIGPTGISVVVGASVQMNVSSPQLLNATWLWTVSDTSRADISTTGLFSAKRAGSVAVHACALGHSACAAAYLTVIESSAPGQ